MKLFLLGLGCPSHSQFLHLLALIDSGTIPEKDWLFNFAKHLKQENKFDLIFGAVFFKTTNIFDQSYASIFIDKNKNYNNYLMPSVACMFIKYSIWKRRTVN